jgi:hybrid cluster-associated redox disulfide protein
MEHPPLTGDLTVAEVLTRWPQAIQVFFRHRMACVGCTMAPFDTIADAAAIYGLPLSFLLSELHQVIHTREAKL